MTENTEMTENTTPKQRGGFKPGQSGNPAGKPKGARNKTTLAVEALLDGEAEALTRKAIEKALEGDSVALRLCLERIIPVRRERPTPFAMPKLEEAAGALWTPGGITRDAWGDRPCFSPANVVLLRARPQGDGCDRRR